MYRLKDRYQVVFCDIDDTLITGFITDLMTLTWKLFKSPLISKGLMELQARLGLYKVNSVLLHSLGKGLDLNCHIVFLTARAESKSTYKLLEDIIGNPFAFDVVAIGTDEPAKDKVAYMLHYIEKNNIPKRDVCIVDDDIDTCREAEKQRIDSYNPEWYLND